MSHVNANKKLLCAAGFGAAVQLAMAYELSAVATRDKNAGVPATYGDRPGAGVSRRGHVPAQGKHLGRPVAATTT